MEPITSFEESKQPPHFDSPIGEMTVQGQAIDFVSRKMASLHRSTSKKRSKIPRDEEPPPIYPQQPSSGVRKRTQREPARNSIPRPPQPRTAPETMDRSFILPPSLVSQYPALGRLQQQQMSQQMPGTYRTMYQAQSRSGSYRSFEGTGSTESGQADNKAYSQISQMQAPYQRPTGDVNDQNARKSQGQGNYRTFEAKEPMSTVSRHRMPVEGLYDLTSDSQSVRSQFGSRLPPPYELSKPEQFVGSENLASAPSLHQHSHSGSFIPIPNLPSYESPYILTPQMESSFGIPDESDVLANFDFDAFLKSEEAKDDTSHDSFLREGTTELTGTSEHSASAPSLQQRQADFRSGVPDPNLSFSESPFVLTPQMEPCIEEVD